MSWLVQLLPYIEEGTAFKHIDFSVGVYDKKNAAVRVDQPLAIGLPDLWRPVATRPIRLLAPAAGPSATTPLAITMSKRPSTLTITA